MVLVPVWESTGLAASARDPEGEVRVSLIPSSPADETFAGFRLCTGIPETGCTDMCDRKFQACQDYKCIYLSKFIVPMYAPVAINYFYTYRYLRRAHIFCFICAGCIISIFLDYYIISIFLDYYLTTLCSFALHATSPTLRQVGFNADAVVGEQ
eukprot:SAG11_NODE_9310_length_923_cov_1.768204_1_plen_153_part_10